MPILPEKKGKKTDSSAQKKGKNCGGEEFIPADPRGVLASSPLPTVVPAPCPTAMHRLKAAQKRSPGAADCREASRGQEFCNTAEPFGFQ